MPFKAQAQAVLCLLALCALCGVCAWIFELDVFTIVSIPSRKGGEQTPWFGGALEARTDRRDHYNHSRDGCGLIDNTSLVRWSAYSQEEIEEYNRTLQCLLHSGVRGNLMKVAKQLANRNPAQFRMLRCDRNVTATTVQETLARFEHVWFIGDSTLEQQFYTLLCTLDSTFTRDRLDLYQDGSDPPRELPNDDPRKGHAEFSFHHTRGSTRLMFFFWGNLYDSKDRNLWDLAFPQAIANSTSRDAIVMLAGYHYKAFKAPLLQSHLLHISKAADVANTTIFLVEPAAEHWPTSNGIHVYACEKKCTCQPLDEDRLWGHGVFNPNLFKRVQANPGDRSISDPPREFFEQLYPGILLTNRTCIPDCLPSTWRIDIMRQVTNATKAVIVPTFWQFAASGDVHSLAKGDCLHRTINAVVITNQQLVRALMDESLAEP